MIKQSKDRFDFAKDTKSAKLHLVGFFKQPLSTTQVDLVVNDITDRTPREVLKATRSTEAPGKTSLQTDVELDQSTFPNGSAKLQFIMKGGATVLASGQALLIGEAPKTGGKVNFSEDGKK